MESEREAGPITTSGRRISQLDAVRGFALCGIHVVNIYQQIVFPAVYGELRGLGIADWPGIVHDGFYERFFPIFTLMFGVGFGIFLASAGRRTDHPRRVLARRLAALLVIGLAHQVFHLGEALVPYAVFGLVFLLPASFLSPRVQMAVGAVLLLVGGQLIAGYGVMPGLLVFGLALAGLGVPHALGTHTRRWALATAVFGALTLAYWATVIADVDLPRLSVGVASLPVQLAGVAAGMFYACLFVLVLHSPAGRILDRVFAPMGRMALTNYLMATAIMLALAPVLGIDSMVDAPQIVALVLIIIAAEALWSPWWLHRFRHGPFEWLWRCATWWTLVPVRPEQPGNRSGV